VQNASDDAWQDVKSGTDKALNELSKAFDDAAKRFK